MFISKKTYNEFLNDYGRALDLARTMGVLNEQLIQECKEIQELNKGIHKTNEELLERVEKLDEENSRLIERLDSKCVECIAWNNNETLRVFTESLEEELNKIPQHHFTLLEVLNKVRSLYQELKEKQNDQT